VIRAVAVLAALLVPSLARADERITDDLPFKVPEDKVRVGLWKLQYGVHEVRRLEVGTYLLPYVALAAGVKTVNGHAKYQFYDRGRWTFAGGIGATYVDLNGLDIDAQISIVPMQLLGAAQLGRRWTLGAGLMWSRIDGAGAYNRDDDTMVRGAVAVSNAQSWLSATLAISRGWSLYLETRAISSTNVAIEADATHQVDDRTTVDVAATGKASIEALRGGSVTAAFHWSGERFRLRIGAGWGNYNVPVVNFVTPFTIPYPELDVYWVF
jgi:hypothetical protein